MLIGTARTRRKGQRWFDQRRRLVELVDPVKLLIGRSSASELGEPVHVHDGFTWQELSPAADDGVWYVWQYT